ncbi:TPA: hypothetical protein DD394_07805 [bacterium UBP9_UBA11836]|nr:hypothetical protein [bacterium UBP9_UBA11836]
MMLRNIQGAKDVLASEVSPWHFVENVAIELAEIYGYQEVRTPVFESADLFAKGMGSTSSFVENDIWTVTDKQNHRFAMRANMLVPMIRAINDENLPISRNGEPAKLYYLAPVFAAPKGRDQSAIQSHRFGVGAVGSILPSLDVEALMIAYDFFNALGLSDLKVQLNSLGCKKCRAEYQQGLFDYFSRRSGELCPKCHHRYRTHPLWTMGCEEKCCRELSQVAPSIFGYLCPECREHFEAVRAYLDELKVSYRLSPLLVPDVECYNRTVFQISCGRNVLSFGGRCDELSRLLGGRDIPAVDCAVDLDMTLRAVREANLVPNIEKQSDVCLAGSSQAAVSLLLPVLYALRRAGIYAELAYPNSGEGNAWEAASHSDAQFVIYLDDSSLRQRVVRFRELTNSFRDSRLDEAVRRIGRYFGIDGLADELRPVEVRKFSISRRQPASMRQTYEIFEPTHQPEKQSSRENKERTEESSKRSSNESSRRNRRQEESASAENSKIAEKRITAVSTPEKKEQLATATARDNMRNVMTDMQAYYQNMTPQERAEFEMTPLRGSSAHHSIRSRRTRNKSAVVCEEEAPSTSAQEKVCAQIRAITSAVEDVLGEPESVNSPETTHDFAKEVEAKVKSETSPTRRRRRARRTEVAVESAEKTENVERSLPTVENRAENIVSDALDNSVAEEIVSKPEPMLKPEGETAAETETVQKNETVAPEASPTEVDAIAEISASANGMSEEQIEQALALPKVEGQSFVEVDEPVVSSIYRRRFNNGSHASDLEEADIEAARRSYDRAFSSPRNRRDDYSPRKSRRREVSKNTQAKEEVSAAEKFESVPSPSSSKVVEENVKPASRRRSRSAAKSMAATNYDYRLSSAYDSSAYNEHVRSDYMSHYDDADTYDDYVRYYGQAPELEDEKFEYPAYGSYNESNYVELGTYDQPASGDYIADDLYENSGYGTSSDGSSRGYSRRTSSGSRSRRRTSSSSTDSYRGNDNVGVARSGRRSGSRSSGVVRRSRRNVR